MTEPILEIEGTWEEIRARDAELAGRRVRLTILSGPQTEPLATPEGEPLTAREIRRLPPAERARVLSGRAAIAEEIYRNNPELTAFEAYGEEDLFDDTP